MLRLSIWTYHRSLYYVFLLLSITILASAQENSYEPPPAVHYTIQRRGGPFAPNWTANLDYLAKELKIAEQRFNVTRREVKGNKIVRVPKERSVGGGEVGKLIGEFGREGNWYATFKLGSPVQKIKLDLDMLTKDFALTSTSSALGSRFDRLSKSYAENPLKLAPFPNCGFPSDKILLPTVNTTADISFAHCSPKKQSLETLRPSGATFGLAPSESLSQMMIGEGALPGFIQQLKEKKFIDEEVFSLTLINGEQGILSVGGTIQDAISRVEARIENFLGRPQDYAMGSPVQEKEDHANAFAAEQHQQQGGNNNPAALGQLKKRDIPKKEKEEELPHLPPKQPRVVKRGDFGNEPPAGDDEMMRHERAKPRSSHAPSWKQGWKWSPVEGAAGWWQILLRGIWTDQVKIMKNQPAIIDLNTPFILAPPLAAKAFYASISGSYRLPPPYSNFYAYPCNNPPMLHFEFGGWRFPIMRGTKSATEHRGANGKFSLGKVKENSGYCVGAVVETRMGVGDSNPVKRGMSNRDFGGFGSGMSGLGLESGMLAGNGLRDVWVLGEPVFRGVGLVFDIGSKEVGFRTY